jgi:integrase
MRRTHELPECFVFASLGTIAMSKLNAKNERTKRAYFRHLKEAKRLSAASVDAAAAAIDRFESYTRHRDLAQFHIEQAIGFKDNLAAQINPKTKQPLSKATQLHTVSALRSFILWLAEQPGYRKRIKFSDADYFSLSLKNTAIAKTVRDIEGPTLDQVRHVLRTMPNGTDMELRNRALIAFTLLTGARDDAMASMRLKHVDLATAEIRQDARDVRTKASKTILTCFLPVGEDVRQIVVDWVEFLQKERNWGLDDPLFPMTQMACGKSGGFEATGLKRECWKSAAAIRTIFRNAFTAAGLPYFNPHSFRKTLVRLGQRVCTTPEMFKAWSQNVGHEEVLTTFTSYGQVDQNRQREIIRGLREPNAENSHDDLAMAIARQLATMPQFNGSKSHHKAE